MMITLTHTRRNETIGTYDVDNPRQASRLIGYWLNRHKAYPAVQAVKLSQQVERDHRVAFGADVWTITPR